MNERDDLMAISNEHNETVRIERLTHHMLRIRESVDRIDATMVKISDALTRLALVEERQAATSSAIERLAESIEKLDARLRALEIAEPMQAKSAEWVMGAVWASAAGLLMFAAGKIGLF